MITIEFSNAEARELAELLHKLSEDGVQLTLNQEKAYAKINGAAETLRGAKR